MSLFIPIAAALCVLAAALLLRPLWWTPWRSTWAPRRNAPRSDLPAAVQALRRQLAQLAELHAAGTLTDEQFAASRQLVEKKLLETLVGPAGAADTDTDTAADAETDFATDAATGTGTGARPLQAPSPRLAGAMVAFVVIFAGAGYYKLGSPMRDLPDAGVSAQAAGSGADGGAGAHPLNPEQVSKMIDQLAQRLKDRPDDAEGWQMLARSYVAIGQHAQAVDAFKTAARLSPDDANLFADYADALAMAGGRTLAGEPSALIERALKIDPKNPKALALAGTAAFDRKDYPQAVRYWETLVSAEPADSPLALQARGGIAEARELAGMPPAAAPSTKAGAATVEATAAAPAAPSGLDASVSGTITLADSLKGKVGPDDTLFVFARASGSQRMPVAILRKRAGDLPLAFKLDDSMAMSESVKLSKVSRVVVGARISKSGDAMPQDGDLQGMASEVSVGANGVKVEINQTVTR